MLIAAGMKAPNDESNAAKAVWELYYANHQRRGTLKHLKVADPFMGGGTTVVEGSRLGMQMFGCDLNPVAWFVVKNAMTDVDIDEVKNLLNDIEAAVKPQIIPFYACDGPNGEKGKWFHRSGTRLRQRKPEQLTFVDTTRKSPLEDENEWEELPLGFDIFSVAWQERAQYRYEGPEILYTFWAKHGPCEREGCGHRTPIMTSPVIVMKTLSVDAWKDWKCLHCGKNFDVERYEARMAPDATLIITSDEAPFAVMDEKGSFSCPHCGKKEHEERARESGSSSNLGKAKAKKVELTLLINPEWLEGCPSTDERGLNYGGSAWAWLCFEAHALPLMENVSSLTSAKIDLLPHQVVLTHRVATAYSRRFLIADEVGLGKTIEAALILRELVSRGELKRALMVVPAGLVNNWHRELNDVFHLNFEVFGSEGDVTDRKSNAFEKHNLLIASIDTLKLRPRMARLKAAPPWDLVVFDEAHHLSAYRQNGKLIKTQNFKLAEMLKEHTRDLVLLSATPHQGDHFRFWMLVQMLDPTLFNSPAEMVQQRHRLNSVIFRRTKADACRSDGSTLFARRQVFTESFTMSTAEKVFYEALVLYLQDGFALAKRQGRRGQGLAFVMTIFQKIAASSFAAVQRTLRRRLIALTVQEALMHDQKLDIDQRNAASDEARLLIRELHDIAVGRLGDAEVDRILADYRYKVLRQQREEEDALGYGADEFASETAAAAAEDAAATSVSVALPEERRRICTSDQTVVPFSGAAYRALPWSPIRAGEPFIFANVAAPIKGHLRN